MSPPPSSRASASLLALETATRKYRRVTRPRWSAVKVVGPAGDKTALSAATDTVTAAGIETPTLSKSRATIKSTIDSEMDDSDFVVVDKPAFSSSANDVSATTNTKPPVKQVSVSPSSLHTLLADTEQVLHPGKIIPACARRLTGHTETKPACTTDQKCISCVTLTKALELLDSYAAKWASSKDTFKDIAAAVLCNLRGRPLYQQRRFYALLTKLLDDEKWAETDCKVVTDGDFEISAVLWILKLGPRGLSQGWEDGKSTMAMLMDEEEAWVLSNIEDEKYEDKKQLLEDFADGICTWGAEVAETMN